MRKTLGATLEKEVTEISVEEIEKTCDFCGNIEMAEKRSTPGAIGFSFPRPFRVSGVEAGQNAIGQFSICRPCLNTVGKKVKTLCRKELAKHVDDYEEDHVDLFVNLVGRDHSGGGVTIV